MLAKFSTALVALLAGLDLVSAWSFTRDHEDGYYGIRNGELELIHPWNSSAHHDHSKNTAGTHPDSTAVEKRQALPGGRSECTGGYVPSLDVSNCLVQAEAFCGLGTLNSGGTILNNYEAYAFKSNLVFLYICNWNKNGWFSSPTVNCWAAEVAAMIGLVENDCGAGSGNTMQQGGWYLIDDWNVGMGFTNLGVEGCPGLGGNHDGQGVNPAYVAPPAHSSYAFLAPVEEKAKRSSRVMRPVPSY